MLLITVPSTLLDTTGINHVGISCIMRYNVATCMYIIRSSSDKTMAYCLYEVSLAEIKLFLLFTNTINVNISELIVTQ
mgnify:FL=1